VVAKTLPRRPAELEALPVCVAVVRELDLLGDGRTKLAPETLPLAGQEAMALQVAEGSVVRDDLEAVADGLEAAARLVAAVFAPADELGEERCPLAAGHRRHGHAQILLGQVTCLVEACRDEVLLGPSRIEQRHR